MRKNIIAGNWKMNNNPNQAVELIKELEPLVKNATCGVVVCVPYIDLHVAVEATKGTNIAVGAQNCHWENSGAYTGEISATMLKDIGVEYVVIGHSERRQYFGEIDTTVNMRTIAALNAGLKVIVCVGELLNERELGITKEICALQSKIALKNITAVQMQNIIIAYEPVWAIGTGKTATSDEAQEVCAFIRSTVCGLYDATIADNLTVQYGGSMNAGNAAELIAKPDVDGGLIGGASLKAVDFAKIVESAS